MNTGFWSKNAASLSNLVPMSELKGLLLLIMRLIQVTTIAYNNEALQKGAVARSPDYCYIKEAYTRCTWAGLSQMPPRYLEDSKKAPLQS